MAKILSKSKVFLGQINENALNLRSMNEDDIRIMADNIAANGLMQPPVVYKSAPKEYVLLGGHRRCRALRMLGCRDDYPVDVVIMEKPKDEFEEQELLTSLNISRKLNEDVENEIIKANQTWASMDAGRRENYCKYFRKQFIERNKKNPKYIEDPDTFITNNFRARCSYIRFLTTVDYSNKTIKKVINKLLPKEEKLPEGTAELPVDSNEVKASKSAGKTTEEKTIVYKDVLKEAKALWGMLELYEECITDKNEAFRCSACKDEVGALIDYYESRKEEEN
ncbi:MAG: ParB N-terminal domain-containing protein [Erysipelotrichaceae bacterium]|nr:ParB N-terminal domain-containing protein [Erysipelotrichaceae bacterium]